MNKARELTPKERTCLRIEIDGFFNNSENSGDVQGELYALGLDHADVIAIVNPLQKLWDAIHGLKTERFDTAYLDVIVEQRQRVNAALAVHFIDFKL